MDSSQPAAGVDASQDLRNLSKAACKVVENRSNLISRRAPGSIKIALGIFLLTVVLTAIGAPAVSAQQSATAASPCPGPRAAPTQRLANGPLNAQSFSARGLTYEDALTALFRGDFRSIKLHRNDQIFEALFQEYLDVYATKCSAYLPPNSVEMMTQECAVEEVTRNGWGVQVLRTCEAYREVGTKRCADPDLYAAKKDVDRLIAVNNHLLAGSLLFGGLEGIMSIASAVHAARTDINTLFEKNACTSPGLRRFQQNLLLFALNKQPLRLEDPLQTSMAARIREVRDQDYMRLISDLLKNVEVTSVEVSSRDAGGRPVSIRASYIYEGFSGRHESSVSVHFTDGAPDCLYYESNPTSCYPPNRRIAAAYAAGAYEYGYE